MSNKEVKSITKWLFDNSNVINEEKYVDNLDELREISDKSQCLKKLIDDLFGTNISCQQFYDVINGEGNEKDKISSAYSSSLQSLLIFSSVNKDNPIKIDGNEYTEAYFEYKNKVIGYPSAIDVVLTNDDGEILFIESKLYEIVRDSRTLKECNENNSCRVVGSSYLSNDQNGYSEKLRLTKDDLENCGFDLEKIGDNYGKLSGTELKRKINNGDGYIKIKPLSNNGYVYAYGIKQLLSHIIGIINFNCPTGTRNKNCTYYLQDSIKNPRVKFISLYNGLPGYDKDSAKNKLADYRKHQEIVLDKLEKNSLGIDAIKIMTYQDVYQDNKDKYFKNLEKVVKYYKLDKK